LRWRLYIEEYTPDLKYIQGLHNVVADALSRLTTDDRIIGETKELFSTVMQCLGADTEEFELHPVSYSHLDLAQQADPQIKKILKQDTSKYNVKDFHGGGRLDPLCAIKEKL
jgi:hypothetical protein